MPLMADTWRVCTARTLSSSDTYSLRPWSDASCAGSKWTKVTSWSGVRMFRLLRSRMVRPHSITCCISFTSASICGSTASAATSGIIRKCTDSGASGSTRRRLRYTSSQKKGVSGAIILQSISSTSYSVARAAARSAAPRSPENRSLFIRMYQLVSCSTRSTSRGTTVYSRYASISVRMKATRPLADARIHRSIVLVDASAAATLGTNGSPVCRCSVRADCTKSRYAWYHGKKMSFRFCFTPSSLNRRSSARTTGELMR
mmetsp:Transcript_42476/g.99493  ORF Transcript_42476/g.99493 Transcript_42476/m.99493 type:complete len:259 (-) Transcript_42476:1942-2718(-)